MTVFATWMPEDQRFAFSLEQGEHTLTREDHRALLAVESAGGSLIPDPVSGKPMGVPKAAPTEAELIEQRHKEKVAEVNQACESAITSGFWSDALGERHRYSSQLDDQLNLTGAILRGLDMPYACSDEQGVKAFRLHTAAQLRQVGDDFTLYKLQLLQHANELKQQLDHALATGDTEAMAQIRWEAVQP